MKRKPEPQPAPSAADPLEAAAPRPRPNWPFLYFNQDGRWYLNRAKRRSKADEAQDLGEAKW